MIRLALTLLVIVGLSGCAFCREHDRACAIAGGIAITSVALTIHGGHSRSSGYVMSDPLIAPDVTTQPVVCTSAGNCK